MVPWGVGHPALRPIIEGHPCGLGDDDYNDILGRRRADAVDRLSAVSDGEARPIAMAEAS